MCTVSAKLHSYTLEIYFIKSNVHFFKFLSLRESRKLYEGLIYCQLMTDEAGTLTVYKKMLVYTTVYHDCKALRFPGAGSCGL